MINFHPNFEKKPLTIEQEKELFIQQTKEGIAGLIALEKQLEEKQDITPDEKDLLTKIKAELIIFRKYIQDFKDLE